MDLQLFLVIGVGSHENYEDVPFLHTVMVPAGDLASAEAKALAHFKKDIDNRVDFYTPFHWNEINVYQLNEIPVIA